MARGITKRQAEKVLATIKKMFPNDADAFTLHSYDHEELPKGSWSIAAEGVYVNDDYWTYYVLDRNFKSRQGKPAAEWLFDKDVFLEPVYGWCLGIYPND